MDGIHVNVQCEQFTFFNQFAEHWRAGESDANTQYASSSTWCNRNSKIGLSHPQMGEIMLATWLLPYNEGVAQWVDPFYDAGADSHTNIMGSMGASSSTFYNPVFGRTNGFNRRQENIIQYWSPNWNGFVFRFAWTMGNRDEMPHMDGEIDPTIRSSSLAYTNGPLWLAVTWQDHEDWAAASAGEMASSDAESIRVAGRYIMDLGDGVSVQLSAMWENIEHEFNGVTGVDAAMEAFGYSKFSSYNLYSNGNPIMGKAEIPAMQNPYDVKDGKTVKLIQDILALESNGQNAAVLNAGGDPITFPVVMEPLPPSTPDNLNTVQDETVANSESCDQADPPTCVSPDDTVNTNTALKDAVMALDMARDTDSAVAGIQAPTMDEDGAYTSGTAEQQNADLQYRRMFEAAEKVAKVAAGMSKPVPARTPRQERDKETAGQSVKIERDAWLISGKIKFGGPVDFRFSYADADDMEVSCGSFCRGDWNESGGDAWNVGLFYTMPAGTELRMTYSEVNSDDNVGYGQSIPGTGVGMPGNEIEMFAVGIVHWFD